MSTPHPPSPATCAGCFELAEAGTPLAQYATVEHRAGLSTTPHPPSPATCAGPVDAPRTPATPWTGTGGHSRPFRGPGAGQALAETALILPVLLFAGLGFVEAGFLLGAKAAQDRATATVAAWAAGHPGEPWAAVAAAELPGCDVTVAVATDPPDLVTASATCTYRPVVTRGLWDGLPISSTEAAAAWPTPDPTVAP
jgi:hypothetical protein